MLLEDIVRKRGHESWLNETQALLNERQKEAKRKANRGKEDLCVRIHP